MKLKEQKILKDPHVESLISNNDYSSAADYLFKSQMNSWELLKRNYEALGNVQIKSFWSEGFKIKVQFNPGRIKSTSAEVDENTVKNRSCFLCLENLPEEQKAILLDENFLLLCNPYPIFPQHFTISYVSHIPQRIFEAFRKLLDLTRLLSKRYTLAYNGPFCGASAPDHLHFQAGMKNFMPVENDIQQMKNEFGKLILDEELISMSFIDDDLRKIIFIESADPHLIENTFEKIYSLYENITVAVPEPLMNIICSYDKISGWNVIIFLRNKHRPESFYKKDPDRMLISPAAIDLGGILVTPREEDFVKTNKEFIDQIFNEVSLDRETFSLLAEKVKTEFS